MNTLTPECRTFLLNQPRTAKLATVRADGRPHIVPIWFDLDGDTLIFATGRTTVKAHNMQRDARVCICVDDEQPPFSFAKIEGTVSFIDDHNLLMLWATRLGGRYMGAEQAEAYGRRNAVEGELLVRVTPTKVLFMQNVAE